MRGRRKASCSQGLRAQILSTIDRYPRISLAEVARRCGCSPMAVQYHVKRQNSVKHMALEEQEILEEPIPACEKWLRSVRGKCSTRCWRGGYGPGQFPLCKVAYQKPPYPVGTEVRESAKSVLVTR